MDACVYAGRITPDEEGHVGFAEDKFLQHLKEPLGLGLEHCVELG